MLNARQNMILDKGAKCLHSNEKTKMVDHMATHLQL
jgi:hypothetical protein